MKIRNLSKVLLTAILAFSLTAIQVSAAERAVIGLGDGTDPYKLVIDNLVDIVEMEVFGELSNVALVEKPDQNENGSYTFFEIETTDTDARDIFSFVRVDGEQLGDFISEIDGGNIKLSPHIYDDFDELSKDAIFSVSFYITNSSNERTYEFSDIYFKFISGDGTSEEVVENVPVEEEVPLPIVEIQPPHDVIATKTEAEVSINNNNVSFEAYNIDGYNYFKLRDLASAISGTEKQFEVTWDGEKSAINLIKGEAYTTVGGELTLSSRTGSVTATSNQSRIYVNGEEVALQAYTIDGNNYFKLRDVAEVFDFEVAWDGVLSQIAIDTAFGYTAE